MFICIDDPGAFAPSKEWREHLDHLLSMEERDDPAVQDAIVSARYNLARSERREKEMRKHLALEKELRKRPA